MWEEKDKERKGGSTTTKPTGDFAFTEFDIKKRTVLKLVRNSVGGKDGAEEKKEHNYKHPLAVQHA